MLSLIVFSAINGLSYGMLLFMLASGLTVILSLMGVLNFAHASLYMLGAYLGFEISKYVGFWPGIVLAPLLVGFIGAMIERFGLRKVHALGPAAELLFTFGLAFIITEAVQMIWGKSPVDYRIPPSLDFTAFELLGFNYPAYRLFMLAVAGVVFLALTLALTRTRIGLVVQAALSHPHMVALLGHNVPRIFMLVFGLGAALAGLAGAIAGPALVTAPDMASHLGALLFVLIIVGGLGSLIGALVASLLLGLIQTFAVSLDFPLAHLVAPFGLSGGSLTLSQISPALPYLFLVLILIFRPTGLMGNRE